MKAASISEVFIFIDDDHGDILVFTELDRAQNEGWPADIDWEEEHDAMWVRGDSCKIVRREIDEV